MRMQMLKRKISINNKKLANIDNENVKTKKKLKNIGKRKKNKQQIGKNKER